MGRDTEGEGPRAKLAYGFITLSSLLAHVLIVSIINSKKKIKWRTKTQPGPQGHLPLPLPGLVKAPRTQYP